MEAAQRIHKHAARRDPAFASARPAHLARDEELHKRLFGNGGRNTPASDASNQGILPGAGAGTGAGGAGNGGNKGGGKNNSSNPADSGAVSRTESPSTTSTSTSSTPMTTSTSSTTPSSTRTTTQSSTTTRVAVSTRSTSVQIETPTLSTPLASFSAPTSQATVVAAATPTPTLNTISASNSSKTSGPGVGPIIGIVAGSLAGAALLFVICGFIWKKFSKKEDPYEADPFDKDAFRRHSAMLPDTFDDEVDGSPDMSEHHQFNSPTMYEHHDPSLAGMAGMGIMAAGAGGAAGSALSHNESGGPRPPTMFQKHINAYDANAAYSQAPPVPAMGAAYDANYPQLPPLAFGGADPYGAAGVASMSNVSNPYAHLDRAHTSGSDGSGSGDGGYAAAGAQQYHQQQQYDTAGRPGTAEGRSGTPDLPNMQHTYAAGFENEDTRFPAFNSPQAEPLRNPFDSHSSNAHQPSGSLGSNGSYGTASVGNYGGMNGAGEMMMSSPPHNPHVVQGLQTNLHPQPSLSVRNLMPSAGHQQQQQQQRPFSTVSSAADPDDAYGGVY